MKNEWTIEELSSETSIPRRTIHFYVQQAILPPPVGAGLGARYSREHFLRLKAIPTLRQAGLRLDDIRERFARSTRQELEALTAAVQADRPPDLPPLSVPGPIYKIAEKSPELDFQPVTERPILNGEEYIHYQLPGGAILLIPGSTARQYASQLDLLLQHIRAYLRSLE